MLSSSQLFSLAGMLCNARKFSLIVLCSALMACGGGGSSTDMRNSVIDEPLIEEPVAEEPVVEEPVVEEPVIEEPIIEEPGVEEPEAKSQ